MRKLDLKVLNILGESCNDYSQLDLANSLNVSKITLCRSIKRLKELGLIKVKQTRSKGRFSTCFYSLHRLSPYHVTKLDILINKRSNINKALTLIKRNRLASQAHNQTTKLILNRLIYIIKLFQLVTSERSELFFLDKSNININTTWLPP